MGLSNDTASLWSQLYEARVTSQEGFSLCYSRSDQVDPNGTVAGAMSLGGTDVRLHQDQMVYSVTDGWPGFYTIHVRKVHLQASGLGENLSTPQIVTLNMTEDDLNRGSIIVDSGTTDTYLTYKFGDALNQALVAMGQTAYGEESQKYSLEEVLSLPTIIFQLAGDKTMNPTLPNSNSGLPLKNLAKSVDPYHPFDILVAFPPTHYYEYDPYSNIYVARLYVSEFYGGVLGANFMMGHDVYFDVENGRLGWAESDCNYTQVSQTILGRSPSVAPSTPPGASDSPSDVPTKMADSSPPSDVPSDTAGSAPPSDVFGSASAAFSRAGPTSRGWWWWWWWPYLAMMMMMGVGSLM